MSKFALYDRSSMSALRSKIKEYFYTKSETNGLLDDKVDKVSGKGLSTEDYTTAEKNKLSGIAAGAEVNVQSDWNQSDSTKDDYIKNKPTLRQPASDGTSGQYLKSNGNGNVPSWETMDSAPTENSTKAVTSGGVKTALDSKQASVTITTNANTPTDNDTVIMQDSGNTGTTSFLRRKLSTLWNYFKGKADGVYVPFAFVNLVGDGGSKNLWDNILDGKMWGADQRFNVTWVSYDIESGEVVETKDAKNLFNMADNYYKHPITGEKDIITISPKDGLSSSYLWTYCHGYYYLNFYSTKLPESATLRWKQRNSDTWNTATFETFGRGNQTWRALIPWGNPNLSAYVNTIEITIIGKTDSEVAWPGTSVCNLTHICTRETLGERGVVTKYAIAQNLYGDITAPKFITRGGTTSQFVLGDGTLQSSPIPVSKGGTGKTTLNDSANALINALPTEGSTPTDADYYVCQYAGGGTTTTTYYRRPMSALWTYIKGKISSVLGIQEGTIDGKVNLLADFTINSIEYSSSNVGKYQKLIRFPRGSTIIINVIRNHTMYGRTNSHTNMLIIDGYSSGSNYVTTLTQSDLKVVNEGNYSFVICPCASYYGSPIFTYRLQILFSSVSIDNIEAVESSVIISASPRDNFVIYNKPVTLGSYTFNMSGSITNLYLVQGNDHFYSFIGDVTGTISENHSIYLRNVEIGQIYQFVFTEEIPAGLKFVDDDNYYDACTIPTTIGAGDTLTLTAASATQDGWLYSIQKFEIESPDESIDVKYSNGITKLEVSKRFVKNNAEYYYEDDEQIAIGSYAQTLKLTGDNNARFAYTKVFSLQSFKVDGGSDEFYHIVTQGTTYTISVGSYSTQFTAARSGCVVLVSSSNNELFNFNIGFYTSDGYYNEFYTNDIQAFRNYSICLLDETSSSVFALLDNSTIVKVWSKTYLSPVCTALGDSSEASGMYATAFGYYARALNEHSIAIGYASLVLGASSIVMGGSAKALKNYSVAIGVNSRVFGSSVGIGYNARCADSGVSIGANSSSENSGVAVGNYASSSGNDAVAIGNSSHANNVRAVAIGYANASGSGAVAIGYNGSGLGYTSIAILGSAGGTNAIAIGFLSNVADNKNDSVAIGYQAKCSDDDSVALGSNTESVGRSSVSIGNSTKCNTNYSIAIGNYCNSVGTDCIAIGDNVKSGNVSNDNNRQYLTTIKMTCVSYECDSQTIYNKRSDVDLLITIDNHQYTLTPPSTNRQLVIVNNSNAQYLKYGSANGYEYVLVDGIWRNVNYVSGTLSGCVTHLHDNYYAVWLYCSDASYHQATESFVFYPLMSTATTPQKSYCVGGDIDSYHRNSHAIGYKCVTSADNQFIIGNYNTLNDNARFIVGGGDSMSRKNILEIDSDDRLKINASLIGGTQTINMTQQTGSLSNITKSIYKIKWNGTGSVRLTLGTNGCVEGQRVSIAAVTNDVVIGTSILIPAGTFGDLLFLDGEWMPSSGVWNV